MVSDRDFYKFKLPERCFFTDGDRNFCSYIASAIKRSFAKNNFTVTQSATFTSDTILTDDVIKEYLNNLKFNSRGKHSYCYNVAHMSCIFRLDEGSCPYFNLLYR